MTSVKKVKVALLALVAALVIAIPTSAFAGTINVTTEVELESDTASYVAYQVFTGNYEKVGNDELLKNVDWGAVDTDAADFYSKISTALGANVSNAQEAVAALNDSNAEAFAAAIADFVTGDGTPLVQDGKKWTASGLADGFWFVKTVEPGTTIDGRDGAYTQFVTTLVGPSTTLDAKAKASIPNVEKGVIEDSAVTGDEAAFAKVLSNYVTAANYDINQGIPYYIAGTLPSEYARFDTYYYEFQDTLSAGLTLQEDSIEVYVYNANGPVGDPVTDAFTITKSAQSLNVKINDLKQVVSTYSADTKIVVLYRAKLNANCVVGNPGNPNEVDLTYSNNPNNTGEGGPTGKTPKKYAIVYTYGTEDTKVDQDDTTKKLDGAGFYLVNNEGKYAKVDLYSGQTGKGTFNSWVEKADATELVTGTDGLIYVKGLDAGTYTLVENTVPNGYNTPSNPNTTVAIDASLPNDATVQAGGMKGATAWSGSTTVTDPEHDGYVNNEIGNGKGSTLPGTGGIGTTIFYIVGIGLILAAAITLVVRRRNATTA